MSQPTKQPQRQHVAATVPTDAPNAMNPTRPPKSSLSATAAEPTSIGHSTTPLSTQTPAESPSMTSLASVAKAPNGSNRTLKNVDASHKAWDPTAACHTEPTPSDSSIRVKCQRTEPPHISAPSAQTDRKRPIPNASASLSAGTVSITPATPVLKRPT